MRMTETWSLPQATLRPGGGGIAMALRRVAAFLHEFHRTRRLAATRRRLAGADDRTLADLGISRAQARFEATRRIWDGPARD